ncbi:hypothetical protein SK128_021631 [Halocaridina rubra]|uniref:Dynein heavy chain linker domain-containing protein n=1 Tax=Halocaridina rubra TaxID=373956 RepID=A0AAN8WIJ3_HALRR
MLTDAKYLLSSLSEALARPRLHCSRFYLLTDRELTMLMAKPSCNTLNGVASKIFNNVSTLKWRENMITGVESTEGEQLTLPEPVLFSFDKQNSHEGGVSVGLHVQQIIDELHKAVKQSLKTSVEVLGQEGRLFRSLLQEQPTSAVVLSWRVWWAAGMDVALRNRAKGKKDAFQNALAAVSNDIIFLLEAMGCGTDNDYLNNEKTEEEGTAPLSSVRTSSRLSSQTARRATEPPIPSANCLPLLMACLHARDIIATLIRKNTSRVDCFSWLSHLRYTWQSSESKLMLQAAHCILEYGCEYSGCGAPDYVLTQISERSILVIINALSAHTPPMLFGEL